jgi:hypothetical protein
MLVHKASHVLRLHADTLVIPRYAQDDKGCPPLLLSWPDELIVQSIGIHGNELLPCYPSMALHPLSLSIGMIYYDRLIELACIYIFYRRKG